MEPRKTWRHCRPCITLIIYLKVNFTAPASAGAFSIDFFIITNILIYIKHKGNKKIKINCDYCGASIDISKNKVCPHCGASYADDQELINNKKREEEIKNIDVERKKLELENQKIYQSIYGIV